MGRGGYGENQMEKMEKRAGRKSVKKPSGEEWLKITYDEILTHIKNNSNRTYNNSLEFVSTLAINFGLSYRTTRQYVTTLKDANKITFDESLEGLKVKVN